MKFHIHDGTLKDEKQHDAVDKSTLKQQVYVLDSSYLRCVKNWAYTLVLVGLMVGRLAGHQAGYLRKI